MSLKNNIIWSYTSRYASVILQFGSSIFLARLLTPAEIGIYSVALSLIGFVYLLRDFGIGEYLVQEKELTTLKTRSAFTLGLLLSSVLFFLVYFSAGLIANFYEQIEVKKVIQLIAINFLLTPFSSPIYALLRRNMQFKQRTQIEVFSALIHAVVAIGLAYSNFGVLSLAYASLSANFVSLLLCQLVRSKDFSYLPSLKEVKSVISYGSFASASKFIQHGGISAPDLLLGKFLGMASVGLFNRGMALLRMIQQVLLDGLRPVLMPYFSQMKRNKENPADSYIIILSIALAIMWPCYAFLLIEAPLLIELLFGEQWLESIPLLQVMCIASFFGIVTIFSDELFKATGHVKKFFVIEMTMTPLRILAVFLGAQYSLLMVVIFLAGLPIIRILITNYFIYQFFTIDTRHYFMMLLKNLILLSVCAIPLWFIHQLHLSDVLMLQLFIDLLAYALLWLMGVFLIHRQLIDKLWLFLKEKKPS